MERPTMMKMRMQMRSQLSSVNSEKEKSTNYFVKNGRSLGIVCMKINCDQYLILIAKQNESFRKLSRIVGNNCWIPEAIMDRSLSK